MADEIKFLHLNNKTPIVLLLIEDNPADADLLLGQLEDVKIPYRLLRATSLWQANEVLSLEPVNAILLDLGLPDKEGLNIVREINRAASSASIVVLIGQADEEFATQAIHSGAQDYLFKGTFSADMLHRTIRYSIERKLHSLQLDHLNRILAAIRNINQLIVHEKDPQILIRKSCDLLTETRGYHGAWIVLGNGQGSPQLQAQSGWGSDTPLEQSLAKGEWPPCSEMAFKTETPIILNPKEFCTRCPIWTFYGHDMAIITQLSHDGNIFGLLGISLPRGILAENEERLLVQEVAGDIAYALHSIQTELKKVESEWQLSQLFQAMAQGVVFLNREGRIIRANPAAEKILGLSLNEMLGITSMDPRWRTIHEDGSDFPGEEHYSITALRTGKPTEGLMGIYNPKEECHRWIYIHATPEFNINEDTPHRVFATFKDVTIFRRVEEELREKERLLNFAIEQMPVPLIIATAPDVKIIKYNSKALELLAKISPESAIKSLRDHRDYLPTFHLDGTPCDASSLPLTLAIKEGITTRNQEIIIRHPDRDYWVSVSAAPMVDDEGNIVAGIVVFPDITEAKLAEQKKAELENQLHQSQKMEAIGRLSGGVAHDFNNLLTIIQGYAELSDETLSDDDPNKVNIHQILKAAASAAALTQQLLAFSRRQIVTPQIVNLSSVLQNSQTFLKRLIGEDIGLHFKEGKRIGLTKIDPSQVEQILVNLAVNARDAMPDGGSLTLEIHAVDLENQKCQTCYETFSGGFVLIAVSDTGVGMDEITKKQIFEPFYTTKAKGKGTGLGLSTIHGIVHQNNGHIDVYSEPSTGTTFKIYLPVTEESKSEIKNIPEYQNLKGSETILLVEDMESVRKLARKSLAGYGYTVIEAEDGVDGLSKSNEWKDKIDLLLTDVVMPKMSGRELYENLSGMLPHLIVLYMSGYTENIIAHHGILDEGTNFIQKPFKPKDLVSKVRQILDARGTG